jgi:Tfp pilus assembly protein PilO
LSYALRNSIVFVILLVVVSAVGFYWVGMRGAGQVKALVESQKELRIDLDNINSALSVYDTTRAQLSRLKMRWQARSQTVPATDTPARTLTYIDQFLAAAEARVNFDFIFTERVDKEDYSYNTYALQGKGRFEDIYALVWYLEHGQRFYTADGLQLEYVEPASTRRSARWDWVSFKMIIRAYFEPESRVEDLPPLLEFRRPEHRPHNLFRPLITRSLPSNRQGLFDVEGATLSALTEEVAYVVDRKGKMQVLRKGDRVFMGRLTRIDMGRGRVEFELNRGGIWGRHTLTVGSGAH